MRKAHLPVFQNNPYSILVGDTIKIKLNYSEIKIFGFVSSVNVFYTNDGEPYFIYYISSKEKDIVYKDFITWVSDTACLASSESIINVTKKRMVLTERIKK